MIESAVRYFRDHEGVVPHMYQCVHGHVTIGVGFLVANEDEAKKLRLLTRTGIPATDFEKGADFRNVAAQPSGMIARSYRPVAMLHMSDVEIDRMLRQKIAAFIGLLRGIVPNFDQAPERARLGMLDMVYSLGAEGWRQKYPLMVAACREKRWADAARECRRRGVSAARNMDCARLFDREFAGWLD